MVHLIDVAEIDIEEPLTAFNLINNELSKYSKTLAEKTQIVVLNKIDLPDTQEKIDAFKQALKNIQVLTVSAASGKGTKELVQLLATKLANS